MLDLYFLWCISYGEKRAVHTADRHTALQTLQYLGVGSPVYFSLGFHTRLAILAYEWFPRAFSIMNGRLSYIGFRKPGKPSCAKRADRR